MKTYIYPNLDCKVIVYNAPGSRIAQMVSLTDGRHILEIRTNKYTKQAANACIKVAERFRYI